MKYLGYAAVIAAFLGAQFWGVPYYIKSEVADQVKTLNDDASQPEAVTTLVVKMEGVDAFMLRSDASDVRIEKKIDDLSGLFVGYLERQASE